MYVICRPSKSRKGNPYSYDCGPDSPRRTGIAFLYSYDNAVLRMIELCKTEGSRTSEIWRKEGEVVTLSVANARRKANGQTPLTTITE